MQLCRFRFEGMGCQVYVRGRAVSSTLSLGNKGMVRFMKDHWGELDVRVLGSDGPVEIEGDQVVRLITIRVPKQLQDEFEKSAGKYQQDATGRALPILDVYYGVN